MAGPLATVHNIVAELAGNGGGARLPPSDSATGGRAGRRADERSSGPVGRRAAGCLGGLPSTPPSSTLHEGKEGLEAKATASTGSSPADGRAGRPTGMRQGHT